MGLETKKGRKPTGRVMGRGERGRFYSDIYNIAVTKAQVVMMIVVLTGCLRWGILGGGR